MKKFKDLLPQEKLYMLEPLSRNILETSIIKSAAHPKSAGGKVWVLEIYKFSKLASITEDKLKMAKENYDSNTTMQVFVEHDASLAIIRVGDPKQLNVTVICTDRALLKTWMDQQGKEVLELEKELRKLKS